MRNAVFLDKPIFAWCITVLILLSVIGYTLETLPDLTPPFKAVLSYTEIVIVGLFTLEYAIRLALAPNRLKFIFSFYGLIDLIAIVPFYLALAIDLRALRLVRLIRLMRILKLVRYNRALKRFLEALYMVKEELIIYTVASFVVLYFAAVGIYHFEHAAQPEVFRSLFDGLWWSVATLTTVGYGDIYPVTYAGRIFTFIVLLIGLGLIAVPTGLIASALATIRNQEQIKKED